MLGRVKGALAALGGCAALDPPCAPRSGAYAGDGSDGAAGRGSGIVRLGVEVHERKPYGGDWATNTWRRSPVHAHTLLRKILDLNSTRVTGFDFECDALVLDVRPTWRRPRCPRCGRKGPGYDSRVRTWRHTDLAGLALRLRYRICRVDCRRCGVLTEAVPWAPPGPTDFTYEFEDRVAYLAQRSDQTTVSELMRVAWRTVGAIIARVATRMRPADLLDGLTAIGVDELSYRKGQQYVTVVVDHALGRVIWAKRGRSSETLGAFFEELGPKRAAQLKFVTLDMAQCYIKAVQAHAPQAAIVFDRFHVQRLAHDAVDEVRREEVRALKGKPDAKHVKRLRYSLLRRYWNLTTADSERLAVLAKKNRRLYRAYLLKDAFCEILDRRQRNVAEKHLSDWLSWAQRAQLEPFRKLARTVKTYREGIIEYVATGLSNGPVEGLNRKARVITSRAFGFHSAESLIGFLHLCCGGMDLKPAFTELEAARIRPRTC